MTNNSLVGGLPISLLMAKYLCRVQMRKGQALKVMIKFNKWFGVLFAFIEGIGAIIVVPFLLAPIMLVVLKIPTRMTIASSLAITLIHQ